MGFKDTDAALLAGLFGQALYDVVYPKWWGGQGKASEMPVTAKVNEQIYRPGSNYAGGIRGSSWQRSMGAEIESTIPKGVRPKERVDVTQMTPAGMHSSYKPRTGGPKKRGDPYNLDPDNAFCGAGNAININIQNPKFARPKLKGPTASYLQDSINYPIIENPANCKSRIRDIIQEDYREYKMKHKEMEGLSEDEERENSRGEINEDKSKPATSLSIKRSQGFAEDENKSPSKKVVKKVIRKKITGQATDTEGMSPDEIDGTDRDINSPAYKNRKGARAANENLRSKNKANQDTTSPNVTDPEPQSTPEAGGAKNDGKFFGGRKPAANAGGQKADMIAGGLLLPVRKDSLDRSQDNTNLDGGFGQSRGPGYAKGFGNNTNKQLNPEQESRNVNPGNDQRPAGWIGQREVGKEAGRPQINSNIPSIRPTAHSFDENQEGLLDTEGREDIKKFAKMLDNNRSSDPQAVRGNINKANSRQSGNVGGSYKQDEPIDDFQGNDDQNNPARIDTNISGSYSLKRKDDVADLDQDSFRNNLADSGSIGMDSLDKTPKSQNPGDRRQELVPKRSSKTNEQLQVTGAQENSRNNRSGLAPSKGKEASLSKDGSLKSATPKSNNLGKQSSVSSKSGNRQSEPSPYFGGKQRSSSRDGTFYENSPANVNPYIGEQTKDNNRGHIYVDQGNSDVKGSVSRTKDLSKQDSINKSSVQKTYSKTGIATNDPLSASFGNTQAKYDDREDHSFRGEIDKRPSEVADGYSKYQGHAEQDQSIRNTRHEDRYQENIRRTDSHQRETNGTDENLFQYSATNDRLHEDDRINSYDREDGYDIQEYMSSQQGRSGQSYQREVYNKIRSDIMYSKERNDVVDSRISAFETANKLLKSKIIGHLTHHQGKVEQIPDISKRVPQSTLAQSRAVDDRTLYRPPQNISQQAARERGEPLKSRSRGWESQQPQYGGFQNSSSSFSKEQYYQSGSSASKTYGRAARDDLRINAGYEGDRVREQRTNTYANYSRQSDQNNENPRQYRFEENEEDNQGTMRSSFSSLRANDEMKGSLESKKTSSDRNSPTIGISMAKREVHLDLATSM